MATINTRIKLRYDEYANWVAKDPVLYAGEVAVAVALAEANPSTGLHEPCVTMKVGDGVSKYSELAFTTALAGDVLKACKTEDGLTDFIKDVLVDAGILTDGDETGDGKSLVERMDEAEDNIEDLKKADEDIRAEIAAKIATVYKASGSVGAAEELPTPSASTLGNVYNVVADFKTTDKFVEGAGFNVPAGSNVVIVETKVAGSSYDGTIKSAYGITEEDYYNFNISFGANSQGIGPMLIKPTQSVYEVLNTIKTKGGASDYTFSITENGEITVVRNNDSAVPTEISFGKNSGGTEKYQFITPTEEPAEYGYDVVGSFIDLTNYYTKEEIDALIPEAVKDALTPTTNEDGEEEKSPLLEKVEEIINDKVNTLDYEDNGEKGFVTAVTQTDGLIEVIKQIVTPDDVEGLDPFVKTVIEKTLTPPPAPVDPENPTEEEQAAQELYERILAEVSKLIEEALGGSDGADGKDGLTSVIETVIEKAILDAGDPDADPATEPSALNTAVRAVINGELDKLDVTDTAVDGSFVTSVSQTDGLITVVRKALESADIADLTKTIKETIQTVVKEPVGAEDPENPGETLDPNPVDQATYDAIVDAVVEIVMKELSKKTVTGEGGEGTEEVPVNAEFYEKIRDIVAEMVAESIVNGKDGADGKDGVTTTIIKALIEELEDEGGEPVNPEDPEGEKTEASDLNKTVNAMIDKKIDTLDYDDEAVENSFVTSVSQVNGKIVVTRAEIHMDQIVQDPENDEEIVIGGGGA